MLELDKKYFSKYNLIAGVDEAGRGPLAGPVVAASVIFSNNTYIEGVNDSKKISKKNREFLYEEILSKALHVGIGIIHSPEIDKINILQATKKAMKSSLDNLDIKPDLVLIDGNQIEIKNYNQRSIIKGDSKSFSIASASIIAKVTRDSIMFDYDKIIPEYGFSNNKGYGTKTHFKAILEHKASIAHRQSFKPVNKHIPSFKHYVQNNILNKLLIQLAGDYLIKNNHRIIEVNRLSLLTQFQGVKYSWLIKSNIKNETQKYKHAHSKKYLNQILQITFKDGKPKIRIESI